MLYIRDVQARYCVDTFVERHVVTTELELRSFFCEVLNQSTYNFV